MGHARIKTNHVGKGLGTGMEPLAREQLSPAGAELQRQDRVDDCCTRTKKREKKS